MKTSTAAPMSPLDNRPLVKQIDTHNYLSHILEAPEQLIEGYRLGDSITIPALYAQAKQVVILATGELLPVALALEALTLPYSRVPVMVTQDYTLPHWISSDTLVIAIDYSGMSEQVLVAHREAAKRRARIIAVSIGGELAREARRVRSTHITLSYGAPPRAAFFYLLGCLSHIFRKLDLIDLREATINEVSVLCRALLDNIGLEMAQYRNSAKQLAEKIATRRTFIVGSGPLTSIARKWHIDLAASSKVVTVTSTLSEFNDTIINGLDGHTKTTDAPLVIMLQSKYDHPRNKLQQTVTYQVAQIQKFVYEQVFMHPSGSLYGEIVLSALFGTMVSYYVAWLMNKDPSVVEVTSYIKEQLSQQRLFE